MSIYHLKLEDRIESLYARVATLEARIAELSPSPNPFRVTPEGMPSFDVRKRIEALEAANQDVDSMYYGGEIVINDLYIDKGAGPAMFEKIYSRIPKMIWLKKLKMVSGNGNPLDSGLSLLPDISKIYNWSVNELRICAGFDFIPYLENFPSLSRLEIVPHPLRPSLNTNEEKNQKIRDYCLANDITLLAF
jgi:hypothetical protein